MAFREKPQTSAHAALRTKILEMPLMTWGMRKEEGRGRSAIWQRYEEATMRQRRPADPTEPRRCGGPEHHGV